VGEGVRQDIGMALRDGKSSTCFLLLHVFHLLQSRVVVDNKVWVRWVQRSGLWKKVFAADCCMVGGIVLFEMKSVASSEVMVCII